MVHSCNLAYSTEMHEEDTNTDEVLDEDIYETAKDDETEETEQIEITEPNTDEQSNTTQNKPSQPPPIVPSDYEQIIATTAWMPLQTLKQASFARKLQCSGTKSKLVKQLDEFNQKVQVNKLEITVQ